MNKKTLILLLCAVCLLAGAVFLYRNISLQKASEGTAVSPQAETAEPAPDPGESVPAPEAEDGGDAGAEPSETSAFPPEIDFTLTDRNGELHRLSDFAGKPVLINFWATWCGPCKAELPHFDAAYQQYRDQIQFLMVDLVDGSYETESGTIQFAEENQYSFPLYFDINGEGATAFSITAIPYTVAINSEGQIVSSHLGSMSESELADLIDTLLQHS